MTPFTQKKFIRSTLTSLFQNKTMVVFVTTYGRQENTVFLFHFQTVFFLRHLLPNVLRQHKKKTSHQVRLYCCRQKELSDYECFERFKNHTELSNIFLYKVKTCQLILNILRKKVEDLTFFIDKKKEHSTFVKNM